MSSSTADPKPRNRRLTPIVAMLLMLIELVGVPVQLFLIHQALDYRAHSGCGESCAYAGMALVMMLAGGMLIIIPATIAAVVYALRALRRNREEGGHQLPLLFHGIVALLPVILVAILAMPAVHVQPATPAMPTPEPSSPQSRYLAGQAWAIDNNVMQASECPTGDADFVRGCKRIAEKYGSASP